MLLLPLWCLLFRLAGECGDEKSSSFPRRLVVVDNVRALMNKIEISSSVEVGIGHSDIAIATGGL